MQLDKTRIAIRERGILDLLDMSLHVMRAYFVPLIATMAIGAGPLIVWNYFALAWIADLEFQDAFIEEDGWQLIRYIINMSLLVFIQLPLASLFATAYLGQAVFLEQPRIKSIVVEVGRMLPRVLITHGLVRGIGPACLLAIAIERGSQYSPLEVFLILLAFCWVFPVRAFRPFINEIVVLERNPLRAGRANMMTIGRRSSLLHGPSSGDLFVRWLCSSIMAITLVVMVFLGLFVFASGVLFGRWVPGRFMFVWCLPLSMWMVGLYMTVVRFLNYLDLRIRHEGWEVELRLRAESARMMSKLT